MADHSTSPCDLYALRNTGKFLFVDVEIAAYGGDHRDAES